MDERVSSVRDRPDAEQLLPELRDLGGEVVSSLEQARDANSASLLFGKCRMTIRLIRQILLQARHQPRVQYFACAHGWQALVLHRHIAHARPVPL